MPRADHQPRGLEVTAGLKSCSHSSLRQNPPVAKTTRSSTPTVWHICHQNGMWLCTEFAGHTHSHNHILEPPGKDCRTLRDSDVTCFGSWGSGSRSSLSESGDGDEISGCAHESLKKQRKSTIRLANQGDARASSWRLKSITFKSERRFAF